MKNETEIYSKLEYWKGVCDGLGAVPSHTPEKRRIQADSWVQALYWVLAEGADTEASRLAPTPGESETS